MLGQSSDPGGARLDESSERGEPAMVARDRFNNELTFGMTGV